jgi:hypothetical protein
MDALAPSVGTILALIYGIYLFAYPPRHRKSAFLLLLPPITHAFFHHLSLTPWFSINDTFGRFLYIWLANMSHIFLILEFTPKAGENVAWKKKLKYGFKAVFTRHPTGVDMQVRPREKHGLTRLHFCLHHAAKAVLYTSTSYMWDTHICTPNGYFASSLSASHTSFLRRLPEGLNTDEVRKRFMMAFDVCIGDMLYFEAIHSLFAILFVGVLFLDSSAEWHLSLFGKLMDCWSVRRYWGVYWHDYIYAAFPAHVKLVTRNILGMSRGQGRRVLENALVFAVSGLLHSAVRWVQTDGNGECWTVALWYSAQIVPIVLEGVVQDVWVESGVRKGLQRRIGVAVVGRLEKAMGYLWVFCWMFWSVSKWLLTRNKWEMESWRKIYPELFAARGTRPNVSLVGS